MEVRPSRSRQTGRHLLWSREATSTHHGCTSGATAAPTLALRAGRQGCRHDITLLHYTAQRCITLHYTTLTTLHHYMTPYSTPLHYTTLRCTAPPPTLHLHLHDTTHYTTLHYTTPHCTPHYTTLHCTKVTMILQPCSTRLDENTLMYITILLIRTHFRSPRGTRNSPRSAATQQPASTSSYQPPHFVWVSSLPLSLSLSLSFSLFSFSFSFFLSIYLSLKPDIDICQGEEHELPLPEEEKEAAPTPATTVEQPPFPLLRPPVHVFSFCLRFSPRLAPLVSRLCTYSNPAFASLLVSRSSRLPSVHVF